jgi:hypothetical protein
MASASVKKYIRLKKSQIVEPGILKQPHPGRLVDSPVPLRQK